MSLYQSLSEVFFKISFPQDLDPIHRLSACKSDLILDISGPRYHTVPNSHYIKTRLIVLGEIDKNSSLDKGLKLFNPAQNLLSMSRVIPKGLKTGNRG